MHEFKHPNYYKELRKRNKSDQIISPRVATASARRASGPGLNLLAGSSDPVHGQQPPLESGATSSKLQASSKSKPEPSSGSQASGGKRQAPGSKLQASSHKRQAP